MKTIVLMGLMILVAGSVVCADRPVVDDPMSATLTEALTDFVKLLRADDSKAVTQKWCRPDSKLDEFWKNLRECDAKFDYNNWITGKHKPKGDETKFKIGGHSYGHMHIEWQNTKQGWKIVTVWMCR